MEKTFSQTLNSKHIEEKDKNLNFKHIKKENSKHVFKIYIV